MKLSAARVDRAAVCAPPSTLNCVFFAFVLCAVDSLFFQLGADRTFSIHFYGIFPEFRQFLIFWNAFVVLGDFARVFFLPKKSAYLWNFTV
jgi:hypothetical protein